MKITTDIYYLTSLVNLELFTLVQAFVHSTTNSMSNLSTKEASKFYTHSENYWSNIDPSESGMLDGYTELTPGDSRSSLAFIGELRRTGIIPQRDLGTHSTSNHSVADSPLPSPPTGAPLSEAASITTAPAVLSSSTTVSDFSASTVTPTNAQVADEDTQQSVDSATISDNVASIRLAPDASAAAATTRTNSARAERRLCRALDCGAGIGRVTKNVLLIAFDTVDMAELSERSLAAAPAYVGRDFERVERTYCVRLQDFVPDAGREYDVVWLQWIVGHLLDDDLVALLSRLKTALSPPAHATPGSSSDATRTSDSNHTPDQSNTAATTSSRATVPRNARAQKRQRRRRESGGECARCGGGRGAAAARSRRARRRDCAQRERALAGRSGGRRLGRRARQQHRAHADAHEAHLRARRPHAAPRAAH